MCVFVFIDDAVFGRGGALVDASVKEQLHHVVEFRRDGRRLNDLWFGRRVRFALGHEAISPAEMHGPPSQIRAPWLTVEKVQELFFLCGGDKVGYQVEAWDERWIVSAMRGEASIL